MQLRSPANDTRIRVYDEGRDLKAIERIWFECGWLESAEQAKYLPDVLAVGHCLTDQLFIVSVAIGVGCIDQRTSHVKRVPNDLNSIAFFSVSVVPLKAHRAISNGTDERAVAAEFSIVFHFDFSLHAN